MSRGIRKDSSSLEGVVVRTIKCRDSSGGGFAGKASIRIPTRFTCGDIGTIIVLLTVYLGELISLGPRSDEDDLHLESTTIQREWYRFLLDCSFKMALLLLIKCTL